ncbi:MAG: DUF4114 domain-containing protein [Alphaproteobacteria bacterium]|nr:DUF4114 domain-containing protein [Alphaproteobacteria bacterium]
MELLKGVGLGKVNEVLEEVVEKTGVGSVLKGNGSQNSLLGTDQDDVIFAEGGNDKVAGGAGSDRIHGGGGDDFLYGEDGDDIIFGAATTGGAVDLNKFRIGEDAKGTVTFEGESAGYKNALGVYKIAADGTIYDVQVLFANASLKGSGGDLIAGQSSVDLDLNTGDQLGFFVVPNGYSQRGMAKLLSDTEGSFQFVDNEGEPGNVNGGGEVKLVHVSEEGVETVVKSQYGDSVFHSHGGAEGGLNGDNFKHVKAEVDVETGTVRIGFEDLKNGGDKDFDDSVFTLDIGQTNAALLPKEALKAASSSDDDLIQGGLGNDKLFGMGGDDTVSGGEGDDQIWGNSGNDTLDGQAGNDDLRGGSGDDIMFGGDGNDVLAGNSGDDKMSGGAGNDRLDGNSGNDIIADNDGDDKVTGGSGNDTFIAGEGNDFYNGGSGFDTIDFSGARVGINVDMSKHTVEGMGKDEIWSIEGLTGSRFADTIKGDKRDNEIDGGQGDDVIRSLGGSDTLTGGEGNDTFVWAAKDAVDQKTGEHLGVDTITDFSKGDRLDFSRILKGQVYEEIGDVVDVREGKNGATVSVKMGDEFVDVVTVEGASASEVMDSFDLLA